MLKIRRAASVLILLFLCCTAASAQARQRWTEQQARDWYARQPWLVGANYNPVSAINALEMWQADTFDPKQIDRELGWAAGLGMNTMRVTLHDLVWQQDPEGYKKRIEEFLTIATFNDQEPADRLHPLRGDGG